MFSGDLGPINRPIVRDYETINQKADLVFLESTYGDRDHRPYDETVMEFEEIVKKASDQKGKILVPTFAIGRAQQILFHLAIMFKEKKVRPFPVFLDSPMAIEATKTYVKHADLFDDDLRRMREEQLLRVDLRTVQTTASPRESRALEKHPGP